MAKKNPFKKNKWEICYNLVNCFIAATLVLIGSFSSGSISSQSFLVAGGAALVVFLTKFKEYWDGEAKEYNKILFNFVG